MLIRNTYRYEDLISPIFQPALWRSSSAGRMARLYSPTPTRQNHPRQRITPSRSGQDQIATKGHLEKPPSIRAQAAYFQSAPT